jgi:uncharacterized membrane protein YqjE
VFVTLLVAGAGFGIWKVRRLRKSDATAIRTRHAGATLAD